MNQANENKDPYELLPFKALHEVVGVLKFGKNKHGADNWKTANINTQEFVGAALRHICAWQRGDKIDAETGIDHLAHAVCNLLFIQELKYIKEKKNVD